MALKSNLPPVMESHQDKAEALQRELIRKMTPKERLSSAFALYQTAWEIKQSGLRSLHPDWSEEQILARTRRAFLTGYAGD
jgi:hypothetical protein